MRAQILWRKVHYWLSIVAALPLLVVICTGLLLQVKKNFHWIQPREHRGSPAEPMVGFSEVLAACTAVPQAEIGGWEDIRRLDYRPDKRLLKVLASNGWEIQVDPADGRILQVAMRRSDLIESLHDGSWFGAFVKSWVFLPSGVLLAVLWGTGLYLFLLPQWKRLQKRRIVPATTHSA